MQKPRYGAAVLHVLIACTSIFSSLPAKAADKEITVVGVQSCGKWVAARKSGQAGAYQAWLLGYLSGLAVGSDKSFLNGVDSDSMYLWMDNYCGNNPLKSTADGAWWFSRELLARKSK